MSDTWFSSISLGTGVLGLFMVFPLMVLARRRPASFWLGLYLLGIAWAALGDYYRWTTNHHWVLLATWPNACVGTFYYCYVRSIVGLGNGRAQARHFVLPAVYALLMLVRQGMDDAAGALLLRLVCGPTGMVFFQSVSFVYLMLVLRRLREHRLRVLENYSSTRDRDLRWLTTLSAALAFLWLVWVLAVMVGVKLVPLFLVVRLGTFYFVGWYGMRQSAVFMPAASAPLAAAEAAPESPAAPADPAPPAAMAPPPGPAAAPPDEPEKYARSGMTDAAQQLIGERLARRMSQERDYLESDLRLTDLAERIGTTPQLLSQYLNHMLGLSFFDYINGLRIVEVQKMMGDPAYTHSTLLELAHAAGFNSKSTFNTYFKNISGMAPSSWRARHTRRAA